MNTEPLRSSPGSPLAAVLSALAYADVFRWPLSAEDIAASGLYPFVTAEECRAVLHMIEQTGAIACEGGLYSMSTDPHQWLLRADRMGRATRMLPMAKRMGWMISLFPFTRSICISGSLSKGSMDASGDLDWFIITAPNRLWLCRSMLIAFKKVVLLNSKKYFCVNHIIDARHLEVRNHDRFTATEIATLLPVVDNGDLAAFVRANPWVRDHFPAWRGLETRTCPRGTALVKRLAEALLGGALGDRLERLAYRQWQRFVERRSRRTTSTGITFTEGMAQYQPDDIRDVVLAAYEARLRFLTTRVTTESIHG